MKDLHKNHLTTPKVSIVIPSYNRLEVVGQAIDSILNQQCNFPFELVIGDDCSTDYVRELLKEYQVKYPDLVKLIFHEHNIGLGANWASCVKICRGKYITNCDNDDYWHNPLKLQLQVDFLEHNPQYGVCHTDYRTHDRITGEIKEIVVSDVRFEISLQQAIFQGKFQCCNATMMYRKELIDTHVNLDDFIRYQFTLQDWNTWIILSKYTAFYCLPISTATFGVETQSITRPNNYEKILRRFEKEKECYRYVCDMFPDDLPFDDKGYDVYVNGVLLSLAYKRHDAKRAKEFALKMLELGDTSLRTRMSANWFGFWVWWLLKRVAR